MPNFPYTNDETGLDDFDEPMWEDITGDRLDDLEAYLLEKKIDREDSGMAGV